MLDNYEELMKAGTEAARSSVLAQIDEKISAWVSGTQGFCASTTATAICCC